MGKEKESWQLQEQEETARDGDVKRAVHNLIGVTMEVTMLYKYFLLHPDCKLSVMSLFI